MSNKTDSQSQAVLKIAPAPRKLHDAYIHESMSHGQPKTSSSQRHLSSLPTKKTGPFSQQAGRLLAQPVAGPSQPSQQPSSATIPWALDRFGIFLTTISIFVMLMYTSQFKPTRTIILAMARMQKVMRRPRLMNLSCQQL